MFDDVRFFSNACIRILNCDFGNDNKELNSKWFSIGVTKILFSCAQNIKIE